MFLDDVTALQNQGMAESLIAEYQGAVDGAWNDAGARLSGVFAGLGSRTPTILSYQDPARDRETVTALVGMGGKYGGTSARTPAALREALTKYLCTRFAPAPSNRTEWARMEVERARESLPPDPLLDQALATLVRIIRQENTGLSTDASGQPTLCFYFPDSSPDDPNMLAIRKLLEAAGWTAVRSDMGVDRPIKFERRTPASTGTTG